MKVDTSIKIPVERDGEEVGAIRVDPSDVVFAERIYDLIGEMETMQADFDRRAAALDGNTETDRYGIPVNARERLRLMRGTCEAMHDKIDTVFGEGTSAMVFGEARSLDAVEQFFDGIAPYLEEAQAERIKKYTNRAQRRTALK